MTATKSALDVGFLKSCVKTTTIETTPAREAPRVKVIYEGREELASG